MPSTMVSALFPDKLEAIAEIRALLALHAAQLINMKFLSDDMIWDKLMAAEAEAERVLKVFFNAVEVIPDDSTQEEIDQLEASETRYITDSNFDYNPDLFRGDAWGYMRLGYKPVHMIHRIVIRFPSPFLANYTVPHDWIKLDRKYGDVQLVPTSTAAVTPVGAYAIAMWGSDYYPQAIHFWYRAGLKNASGQVITSFATHWNDLVDVVKRMCILKILRTMFLPTSASISADGLSQSQSFDYAVWQDGIDHVLFGPKGGNGGLYTAIHGLTALVG